MLALLMCLQVACVLIACFVPFGFDHPSSWGLDFGHLLLLAALYMALLLTGLSLAVRRRRWLFVVAELALPGVYAWLGLTGALAL